MYRLLSHGGVKLSSIRDDEEKENTPVSVELSKRVLMSAKAGQMVGVSNNSIPDNSENVNSNERNSKKSENRGVNWNDLTEGTDIGKKAEDNSDIRVHPPASKKKAGKKRRSEGGDLVLGVCLTQKI